MNKFIAVGGWTWILGYTHKDRDYLFGLNQLSTVNLEAVELGRRISDTWKEQT